MNRLLILACVTALAATPAASQRAQTAPSSEMAGLQSDYRDEQVRARRLRADATDAAAEVVVLDRQLTALRQAQSTDDTQMAAQRARLKDLSQREAVLIAALSQERGQQGRLLSALQMMSRDPPPPLLIPADKAIDTVRAAILMRAMAPEIERRAHILAERQVEVGRIRRLAVLASERLVTTESAQGDRRGEIETLSARKAALVSVLRADAERSERAARVLEARIRTLGGEVRPLTDGEVDAETVSTRLPGGRSRLTPPIAGAPDAVFGQASSGQASSGQASSGQASSGMGGSSGWRWRSGARSVSAPADARVDYAGPLSGWGQVVILDLGPGWRAVIAGLDTVTVEAGARVTDGQPLGHTPADGELYFELRRDDRPVDPGPWLR
ncbi:murein hydrolase activator EnvC [soil metagenome]